MANRGDVQQLKRPVGFGAAGEGERVVVVQADMLNAVLPTLVVVPLDPQLDTFAGLPLAVRVSATEAGSANDHVAIASSVRVVSADRLSAGRVGRLNVATIADLSDKLRLRSISETRPWAA